MTGRGPAPTRPVAPAPAAPWRIGVDVGGTFTDMVLADRTGAVHTFKVPSVPESPSDGVMRVLDAAAAAFGIDVEHLMSACALFVHGSTVATNTMLEGKGASVGLLATSGFRDVLEVRRGIRDDQWDHRAPFAPVLVPRYLRLPVAGRIDRNGRESAPLQAGDVGAAVRVFEDEGVESIAVCLINSYLNPAHERACAEALAETALGQRVPVSVSCDIAPIMGEYERTSTTVVNAVLAPRIGPYLRALGDRLTRKGLRQPVLLVQSNGGMSSVEFLATRPVNLVLSGPAAGVGALNAYRHAAGSDNLISMEIGGTSCDVMLMENGSVPVDDALSVAGYHIALPSVSIHTVGAGGGTVAGVDPGGLLFVGPRGAGAVPGPACYGLGGTEPTVTDAQLVLGRLRPGPYADGAVALDLDRAAEALERKVAAPLGLTVEEAAVGVIRIVEQNLLHAVQRISIERGHDPKRFILVAAGGAGPMHGAAVGRALGCPRVYVPRHSGVFCALGMLHSDVRFDVTRVVLGTLDAIDPATVADAFSDLRAEARARLVAEGFADDSTGFAREIDLSYRGQQWVVRVALDEGDGFDADDARHRFEAEYDRLYGHIQSGGTIEITNVRIVGIGRLPSADLGVGGTASAAAEPVASRRVFVDAATGWQQVPVYAAGDLLPGHRLTGPLVIEARTTTVLAGADDRLEVDAAGNFMIHIASGSPP